ncbi:MAG TPA: hypothetical protein ENK32_05045 [Anaerolineae bacterium]|nr:hypothetical protein [Anaerolineae bacterium]
MTWFAHHIFILPTQDVLKIVADDPVLSEKSYWVRNLSDHKWPDPESQHTLPLNGLLVVRPVGDPDGHYAFWYGGSESIISWFAFRGTDDVKLDILPKQLHKENPDFNLADYPPIPFLKWLKSLSAATKTTIAYYHCTMWGGDVEIEYSWVFKPNEIAYSFVSSDQNATKLTEYCPDRPEEVRIGDVLMETMKHFGLNLPTPYFALHTRGFPWHKIQI